MASQSELRKSIVCFLFDGSTKYTRMTLNAVNSFIEATPVVPVGLLFPQGFDPSPVLNQISDVSRVSIRNHEQQFANWNPTQYKLDIQKFADEFESIFWLDSDAVVYADLSELLLEFYRSPCKVAFLKDHVCWNPQFLNTWTEFRHRSNPFVPQACFMGFKRSIIGSFFAEWKETWRQWIEPHPFANFPNPLPQFPGSAFCTEQYALGMVLEGSLIREDEIYLVRRLTFPLRTIPGLAGDGVTVTQNSSFALKLSSFSLSDRDISEQQLRLLTTSFSGISFGGSFTSGSFFGSSFGSFSGPYVEFSGPSFNLTSFSGFSGPFFEYSFSGSSFSSGSIGLAGFDNLSSGSHGLVTSGSGGSFWVPVDNIAGGIVHFYSTFYDQSYKWWESNRDDVIPRLGDYWKDEKH